MAIFKICYTAGDVQRLSDFLDSHKDSEAYVLSNGTPGSEAPSYSWLQPLELQGGLVSGICNLFSSGLLAQHCLPGVGDLIDAI